MAPFSSVLPVQKSVQEALSACGNTNSVTFSGLPAAGEKRIQTGERERERERRLLEE